MSHIVETSTIIDAISGLETAANAHIEWLKNFHRIIVCNLDFDDVLTVPDAHTRCVFGKWYHSQAAQLRTDDALFHEIGEVHHTFHELAGGLLRDVRAKAPIDEVKYDRFMTTIVVFNDLLRRLQSELWGRISQSDPLTGLQSWHRLINPMEIATGRPSHKETACTVMCDLDHFKRVNDTYGHQAGDEVLRRVGECLQDGVRPNDLVYRYGGEEFLIYLNDADIADAGLVCDRLRQSIATTEIQLPGHGPFHITASFGIAHARRGQRIDDVVTHCDLALYAAKNNGRNQVYLWENGELVPYRPPAA